MKKSQPTLSVLLNLWILYPSFKAIISSIVPFALFYHHNSRFHDPFSVSLLLVQYQDDSKNEAIDRSPLPLGDAQERFKGAHVDPSRAGSYLISFIWYPSWFNFQLYSVDSFLRSFCCLDFSEENSLQRGYRSLTATEFVAVCSFSLYECFPQDIQIQDIWEHIISIDMNFPQDTRTQTDPLKVRSSSDSISKHKMYCVPDPFPHNFFLDLPWKAYFGVSTY